MLASATWVHVHGKRMWEIQWGNNTIFICSTISARGRQGGREGEGTSKTGPTNLFYAFIHDHITNDCCFYLCDFTWSPPKYFCQALVVQRTDNFIDRTQVTI